MVHVQVGEYHVGHGRGVDARSLESMDCLPCAREVGELHAKPGVDEDDLAAAAHHDHVQRPVEHVVRQEPVIEPLPVLGGVGVGRLCLCGDRQHAIADHQHLDVAYLYRVARRNQLVESLRTK